MNAALFVFLATVMMKSLDSTGGEEVFCDAVLGISLVRGRAGDGRPRGSTEDATASQDKARESNERGAESNKTFVT